MALGTVRDILYIIGEGMNTIPGPNEQAIASKIVAYFQGRGWMAPEDVAYLVQAAGGEIRVPEGMLLEDASPLQWTTDPTERVTIIRTIDKDKLVKEAKVNPDAEVRTVDSGPIDIKVNKGEQA